MRAAGDADALSVSAAAREARSRTALILPDRAITFAELAELTVERALVIRARWQETKRPAVFVANPQLPELIQLYAALEASVPLVPLHPRWSEAECEALRARVRVRVESGAAAVASHIAAILFTSGTSGQPKGVLLSRRAFVASAAASEANLGWRDNDCWLLAMPFAHTGGLSILTRCLAARRTVVVEPTFDSLETSRSIARNRVTLLSVVPTMLRALLDVDETNAFETLRAVLVGGAHCPKALLRRARARGIPALLTYGSTETCSQIATQHPDEALSDADEMSAPVLPGIEVRIVRSKGERAGPIEVRGPVVMDGYLGEPALPAKGWYATGDIGWTIGEPERETRLHVLGRADDTIITGGENVHPSEVELVLRTHPRIRDALVFGVPDEKWGEAVAVALVMEPGAFGADRPEIFETLTEACKTLAPFKHPRRFVLVDELPLNAAGKVDRRAARALRLQKATKLAVSSRD